MPSGSVTRASNRRIVAAVSARIGRPTSSGRCSQSTVPSGATTRRTSMRSFFSAAFATAMISGNDAGVTLTSFDDFQLDLEMLVEYIGFSNEKAIATARERKVRMPALEEHSDG